jgi:iron-regulated transporter 1
LPGLSLAFLFLTVLGFDSITLGYAKSQHLTEITIGIFHGVGSLCGILGTVAFQILNNKFKIYLPIIGLIGSVSQLIFLIGCFVAIWLPGSSFILADQSVFTNCSSSFNSSSFSYSHFFIDSYCFNYISIIVLLGSMSLSRFGLWLVDLVINQIMQENVDESERGTVGGVQNSLNNLINLIKFALVIWLNQIDQFGILVAVSVAAVFISFCLYFSFTINRLLKEKYLKVPVNETRIIRKSMIEMAVNEDIDNVSIDSFNEEKPI